MPCIQALIDYRKEHQRDEDSREFDLNDPDAKKKDLATRVCTDAIVIMTVLIHYLSSLLHVGIRCRYTT